MFSPNASRPLTSKIGGAKKMLVSIEVRPARPQTAVPEWLSNSANTEANATKVAYYNEKFGLNTG